MITQVEYSALLLVRPGQFLSSRRIDRFFDVGDVLAAFHDLFSTPRDADKDLSE